MSDSNSDNRKQQIIDKIMGEIPYIDIKPFSHNIIAIQLNILASEFGQDEANEVIRTTELKDLGWGWVISYNTI